MSTAATEELDWGAAEPVARVVDAALAAGLPGSAVSVAVHAGGTAAQFHRGTACCGGERVTEKTLFDLASLTKVFVAVAALALWEDGVIALDAPVAELVPVGTGPEARRVTMRHLLAHTSGLPATSQLWREEDDPERLLDRVLASPLSAPPGAVHRYSCVGYVAASRVLEVASGTPLAQLVQQRVLTPLGAGLARFGPVTAADAAATEVQPHRGGVRGEVHDELAAALARPVANAGLFGTADDVLALGQALLHGGQGRRGRVLRPETAALLGRPVVDAAADGRSYGQALGFRVADAVVMGSVRGVGHTGFTGTSLLVDPARRTVTVLLTNRVHPTRVGADVDALRRALAEAVAGLHGQQVIGHPAGTVDALQEAP